jgi:hypothetical protein
MLKRITIILAAFLAPVFSQYQPGPLYQSFDFFEAPGPDTGFDYHTWNSFKMGMDGPISALRQSDDKFHYYGGWFNRTFMFTESTDPDDILGMKAATSVHATAFFKQDGHWMAQNGKIFKYLMNIYKAPNGDLYGIFHLEKMHYCSCPWPSGTIDYCQDPYNIYPMQHEDCSGSLRYSLALARCATGQGYPCNGGGWEFLEEIIEPNFHNGTNSNIGGGPYMIRTDGDTTYMYVYFSETVETPVNDLAHWMSVARAKLQDVMDEGENHTAGGEGTWKKFSGFGVACDTANPFAAGCWTEHPISGVGARLPDIGSLDSHSDLVYSKATTRYYMPLAWDAGGGRVNLHLWSSPNGITNFRQEKVIGGNLIYPLYPSIIPRSTDTTSDDGSRVDSLFYVTYLQGGGAPAELLAPVDEYNRKLQRVFRREMRLTVERRPATLDYDGDGLSDLSVHLESGYGLFFIDLASNGFEGPGDISILPYGHGKAVSGDFDGDGRTDFSLKNDDGEWRIDFASNGFGEWDVTYTGWGGAECVPVPADYDGDGKTDLSVFNLDGYSGGWAVDYADNGFDTEVDQVNADVWVGGWHGSIEHPVPADYDGDGKADMSVKDDYGYWWFDYANNGFSGWENYVSDWGDQDYVPAPADYDGDGKADLAVMYTGGYSTWYIDYATNGFGNYFYNADEYHTPFGTVPMTPTPSDYDGDGKADIAGKSDYYESWVIDYSSNGFGTEDARFDGWGDETYQALRKGQAPRAAAQLQNRGGLVFFTFDLTKASKVRVFVHSADGKKVATLFDGNMQQGANRLSWGRGDLSSKGLKRGMYFFTIQADDYKETKKLALAE